MMLTAEEVSEMLEDMEPEEIRSRHASISPEGLALMERVEGELAEVTAFLEAEGAALDEGLPPLPKGALPADFDSRSFQPWWRRAGFQKAVFIAAGLVVGVLLPRPWMTVEGPDPDDLKEIEELLRRTRSGGGETKGLDAAHQTLHDAMMAHGKALFEVAIKDNRQDLMEEALRDYRRALELKESKEALEYLARALEQLGRDKEAELVFERYMAFED